MSRPSPTSSDPQILAKLSRLELRSQAAVEGLRAGRHRSPSLGSSSEFAGHREYLPGDDLRHLDWKVFARSDRYSLRQYEAETDLAGHVVLDCSASMRFGSLAWSKFDYAVWTAASLCRLLLLQRDRASLALLAGDSLLDAIPARGGEAHGRALLNRLESCRPAGEGDPGEALASAAPRFGRRGLVIWISDLLGDPASAARAASRLRHEGHDLLVLRILDPAEVCLPYTGNTRFDGLEGSERLRLDPRAIREAYGEAFREHAVRLRHSLRGLRCEFHRFTTDEALAGALTAFLAARSARLRHSS